MPKIEFMMITAVPEIARYIEERGVDRIFLDMETLGKAERQANMGTPIYTHTWDDVTRVKKTVQSAEVMLRINPVNLDTRNEVTRGIDAGADILMLPYFRYPHEVEQFLEIVDGRVRTNLLFESREAVGRAEQILSLPGIQEVHFGLNDLRIGLGLDFLFESFAGGLIDWLCGIAAKNNLSYGVGGIGRVGKELLPAELVMKENVRVGSGRIILSRVFHNEAKTVEELERHVDFAAEVQELRNVEEKARSRTSDEVAKDRLEFIEKVAVVADKIRQSRAR